jgi:hypothetical protein
MRVVYAVVEHYWDWSEIHAIYENKEDALKHGAVNGYLSVEAYHLNSHFHETDLTKNGTIRRSAQQWYGRVYD